MTAIVPLIFPIDMVVYRLDIQGTWSQDPPGTPTTGFDPILREPIISRTSADVRTNPRQEMAPVTVPVQEEAMTVEELNMAATGNDPLSRVVFVASREDLKELSLIDEATGNCLLKQGDRISHLEEYRTGVKVREWQKPLYVYRIDDGSEGFGSDGYGLQIIYTWHRADSAD